VRALRHASAFTLALWCMSASGQPVEAPPESNAGRAPAEPASEPSCDLMALSPRAQQISVHNDLLVALQGATTCLARKDAQCADDLLSQIDVAPYGDDEKALFMAAQAQVVHFRGDHEAAAKLFREALAQPTVGKEIQTIVAREYANALLVQSDFAAALRVLDAAFDCDTWTAQALMIRAAAYQQIFSPALALANIEAAIRLYGIEGLAAPAAVTSMRQKLTDSLSGQNAGKASADSNTDVIPLVRVAPVYPARALQRGLMGCVQFEFSISENGNVENARVVESSDQAFEQPGLDALVKWRYAPKLEDGLPVRRDNVQTILRWQLEGGRGAAPAVDCDGNAFE
jgi:TonB family protein